MARLPEIPHAAASQQRFFSHYPRLDETKEVKPGDPSSCERMLSEWFGRQVILLASGKSGLHLYLQAKGFHRYRNKLQVPPYLSRCFINAFTPSVFPVHLPCEGDGLFLYHQYGFPQRCQVQSPVVIEDIAHLFFTSPHTGGRKWTGEAAIFSLPKFFAMGGIVGGLVVQAPEIAEGIREMIRAAPAAPPGVREWMRKVIANAYKREPDTTELAFVSSAYELLLEFYDLDPLDLAGFPGTIEEICRIGEQRLKRVRFFRLFFGTRACPAGFWRDDEELLPFALPYFGRGDIGNLHRADRALKEEGIRAGIYHMDVNRNMYHPEYTPCLLLPCHQAIPMEEFELMCRIVDQHDR